MGGAADKTACPPVSEFDVERTFALTDSDVAAINERTGCSDRAN